MSVLIVVPVFDEAGTVGAVVAAAREYGPVLVVDDGSRDGSAEIARRAGAEVIRHPRRRGKGEAILTGIAAARERGAAAVVTLDGDGQHRPSDLGLLLDAARARRRTIVVGGRLGDVDALPPDRLNAIRLAGFFMNWACGLRLHDTQSGFRVYPIELFDEIRLRRRGFVLETEVLVTGVARGSAAGFARSATASRSEPIWRAESWSAGRSRPACCSPRSSSPSTASAGACATRRRSSRPPSIPALRRSGRCPSAARRSSTSSTAWSCGGATRAPAARSSPRRRPPPRR